MRTGVSLRAVVALRLQREKLARAAAARAAAELVLAEDAAREARERTVRMRDGRVGRLHEAVAQADGMRDSGSRFGAIASSMYDLERRLAEAEAEVEASARAQGEALVQAKRRRRQHEIALRGLERGERLVAHAGTQAALREVRYEEEALDELAATHGTAR